jgi:hypothetical protein
MGTINTEIGTINTKIGSINTEIGTIFLLNIANKGESKKRVVKNTFSGKHTALREFLG